MQNLARILKQLNGLIVKEKMLKKKRFFFLFFFWLASWLAGRIGLHVRPNPACCAPTA